MYGKNIKYYRLKNGLTVEQLSKKLCLTKSAISQYENDKRDPDEDTLKMIADIFNISKAKLLPLNNNKLTFTHYGFRRKISATQNEIDILKNDIENKCTNQIETMNILGNINKKRFVATKLSNLTDANTNALIIRKELNVFSSGPISSITNTLESLGIIVITFDCPESIEGLNGVANGIPYIFFNSNRTIERQRFTLIHEFCHLFFNHLNNNDKCFEKYINSVTGHVLIPDQDLFNEFGKINHNMNVYLRDSVAKKYKIAPSCLITRLYECGVITKLYYQNYFKFLNASVGKKNEKTLLNDCFDSEKPTEYNHQVYKALSEELITKSRAAELLNISLLDLMNSLVEH